MRDVHVNEDEDGPGPVMGAEWRYAHCEISDYNINEACSSVTVQFGYNNMS